MVDPSVVSTVKKYLHTLETQGVDSCYAVVYGSQVKGLQHPLSDIDVLVVSPSFDDSLKREHVNLLWRVAARTDSRIEPIPVGRRQYELDDSSAIIEIARREGEIISPA